MHAPVSKPIAQAQRTILAAAYLSDSELKYFTRQQFSALKIDFDEFGRRALKNAREKNLKTEFVRDKNKILESAYLHSEDPLTATVVLSPEFYGQFAKDFGPNFLVAIPNRFSVYVFPALASKYRDYAQRVLQEYAGSSYPVSLEVFELGENGLKAIGTYERGN